MFKLFISFVSSISIAAAAAAQLEEIAIPHTEESWVLERPGMYRVKINRTILESVKANLKTMFSTDDAPLSKEEEEFDRLIQGLTYTHPSRINLEQKRLNSLRSIIFNVRRSYELPLFPTTTYATVSECLTAFNRFLDELLSGPDNASKLSEVKEAITQKIEEHNCSLDAALEKYITFYHARPSPFRKHPAETYIHNLLGICSTASIDEKNGFIVSILVAHNFLEISGSIPRSTFIYSPQPMVEAYITTHGSPSKIILGCGHADTRPMFEILGLPDETWCGCCPDLPHADAMVVSLHETSADILCDLNHPDLWAPITDASATSIHDESWNLGCYTPETLAQIKRVLKIDGEFSTNSHTAEIPVKAQLLEMGFEVLEENLEKTLLRVRKT